VEQLAQGFVDLFSGAEGSFKNFLRSWLAGMAQMIAKQIAFNAIGGALGGTTWGKSLGFAHGGAFDGGVQKFATGGVVGRPTMFPMRGGRAGLMGEAGPEAIMPLARLPGGDLGVKSSGASVVVNNYAGVNVRTQPHGDRTEIILEAAQMGAQMAESRMERSVRSGYGGLSRGLQSTYGLRRRG
jgi:lambda family phage tail tape measure protein